VVLSQQNKRSLDITLLDPSQNSSPANQNSPERLAGDTNAEAAAMIRARKKRMRAMVKSIAASNSTNFLKRKDRGG
jgi:hypothetical protein